MKKKCLINAKKGLKSALFGVIKIGFVLCTLYTPNFLIRRDLKITLLFTTVLDTNDMKLAISKSHFRKKKSKKRNPIWSAEIDAIWLASDKNHQIAYGGYWLGIRNWFRENFRNFAKILSHFFGLKMTPTHEILLRRWILEPRYSLWYFQWWQIKCSFDSFWWFLTLVVVDQGICFRLMRMNLEWKTRIKTN